MVETKEQRGFKFGRIVFFSVVSATVILAGCGGGLSRAVSAASIAQVKKAAPSIVWATPAAVPFGTYLSATQLNATAAIPGSFSYSPAAGTQPSAGSDKLTATFTPQDMTHYTTATRTVSLRVNKGTPTVVWATPAAISYGTSLSAAQLNASSAVWGSFTYSPASGTLPEAGSDTLTVKFTPDDTTDFTTVTRTVTLTVDKVTPTLTWAAPAAIAAGTKLSAAQLDATASVAGSFVYSPAAGATPAAGTDKLSVTFTPNNTAEYASVMASVSLVVTAPAGTASNPAVTNIDVGTTVIQMGMKRLGMNIDSQNYYDSGQMLRNLTFRNPGFEGETWQSILQCVAVTANTCTDTNAWTQWPANFLQSATFEFIYGAALGQTGTVVSNTAANSSSNTGVTVQFSSMGAAPAVGDFVVVRMTVPGNAQAGWWTNTYGGGTLTTELADLSPNTIGKQALRMTAAGAGQSAAVDSYFDSTNTHNFVLLNGSYQITFRAKGVGGNNQLNVALGREISNGNYFSQTVALTPAWQDYTLTFSASETPSTSTGTVDLHFEADGASVLLDDVSLTPVSVSSSNPTVFRDEVVNTLVALHPGSLRYMDGLPDFGSSIDNMLTPAFGRQRAGSSTQQTEQDDIAIGLHEFLQLCQTVGAEPWYNLPPAITPTEMQNLIEYLGGDASTTYGAKRATLGQTAPWTSVFPVIHLELGNEQWNYATFPGNAIDDPIAYGKRVATVFGAARSSASYAPASFDLIMGSFVLNSWYTGQEIANSSNYDSISVAPYLFGSFNDTSSNEAIFGPMFAEPEMWDSTPNGLMVLQSQAVTAAGKKLVSYEENIGTQSGTASQSMVNAVVPSVSGGVAMADHMLLQMRDLGIKTQNVWALPEFNNQFNNPNGGSETTPIYGTVIDMGGQTNRRRPVFLAEELVNTAILPNMLGTTVSGANPTWNQPLSTNDSVQLNGTHELQSFAFTDGNNQSVVVVNLSRSSALPVTFSGANAPAGTVAVSQLTSTNLTDTNETEGDVVITSPNDFQPGSPYSLPPFSVTVFTWQTMP
jgi:alpha-L-arabinofuranosidase